MYTGPSIGIRLREDEPLCPAEIWDGSRCPVCGPTLGLDCETVKIEHKWEVPEVVSLQVTNGEHIDVVPWDRIDQYLTMLCRMNTESKIYVFNVGFDLAVLASAELMLALEEGRVIDIGLRFTLHQLAERGYAPERQSLADLARIVLHLKLAKDDEIRLTYTRALQWTTEHFQYAATDALVTWRIGESIPEMVLEADQTRTAMAFGFIERKGMNIDQERFGSVTSRLLAEKEAAEYKLKAMGFPLKESAAVMRGIMREVNKALKEERKDAEGREINPPRKCLQRLLAVCVLTLVDDKLEEAITPEWLAEVWRCLRETGYYGRIDKSTKTLKARMQRMQLAVESMCRLLVAPELSKATRYEPFYRLLWRMLQLLAANEKPLTIAAVLRQEYEDNGGWPKEQEISATAFLDQHISMLEQELEIEFPTTPKSKKKKISKDDLWMLKEKNRPDPLLECYLAFKHAEKMLSTYLKPELVCEDGRVHPRFDVIKKTYRTGCSGPNIQNVPNSDNIRSVYVPSPGCVLLAIDYSQLELCALAQECLDRFGTSRLALLINLGIDVHAWLAGRMLGIITDANDLPVVPQPADVERVKCICKELKERAERKWAKAGNFGFPGGMMTKRFLATCRARGIMDMKLDDADRLRQCWLSSFPEMEQYLHPVQVAVIRPDDRFEEDFAAYSAFNRLGQVRKNCSANAANNFPFQSLAAAGAKRAMWELIKQLPVVNFVHDEFILDIPEELLAPVERLASRIMVEQMRTVIPDVAIRTESMAMRRWNKDAKELRDSAGNIQVWEEPRQEKAAEPRQGA